jgi:hypothetical protein
MTVYCILQVSIKKLNSQTLDRGASNIRQIFKKTTTKKVQQSMAVIESLASHSFSRL